MLDAKAFSRVFKKAQRSRDKFFTVLYRSNGGNTARLGLAIAKKNCKLAAARNRIKRIVRESFRRNADKLQGLDIVVMNAPGTQKADNDRLFASLSKHWQHCRPSGEIARKQR